MPEHVFAYPKWNSSILGHPEKREKLVKITQWEFVFSSNKYLSEYNLYWIYSVNIKLILEFLTLE